MPFRDKHDQQVLNAHAGLQNQSRDARGGYLTLNLWNVAFTRATSRLVVVGNANPWHGTKGLLRTLLAENAGLLNANDPDIDEPLARLHQRLVVAGIECDSAPPTLHRPGADACRDRWKGRPGPGLALPLRPRRAAGRSRLLTSDRFRRPLRVVRVSPRSRLFRARGRRPVQRLDRVGSGSCCPPRPHLLRRRTF